MIVKQNVLPLQEQHIDESSNSSLSVSDNSSKTDPYLVLAREVRDQIQTIVTEATEDGGLGCLINCADEETVLWGLNDVLRHLVLAAHLMKTVVEHLEHLESRADLPIPFEPATKA